VLLFEIFRLSLVLRYSFLFRLFPSLCLFIDGISNAEFVVRPCLLLCEYQFSISISSLFALGHRCIERDWTSCCSHSRLQRVLRFSSFGQISIYVEFPIQQDGFRLTLFKFIGNGSISDFPFASNRYRVFAGVRKLDDGKSLQAEQSNLSPILLDVTNTGHIKSCLQTIKACTASEALPFVGLVNNAGHFLVRIVGFVSVGVWFNFSTNSCLFPFNLLYSIFSCHLNFARWLTSI